MAGEIIPGLWSAWMGLCGLALMISMAPSMASTPDCYPLPASEDGKPHFFPQTHLFQPFIADPKESRFFLSYRSVERSAGNRQIGVVGFGETFPLYRRSKGCGDDGWQVDITGGGIARFDMEDDGKDMIDVDYHVGLPLTWRQGNWSFRTRVSHESSHLGESVLITDMVRERRKRTADSVDFITSYDEGKWRLYTGAEYVLRHNPVIASWGLHLGTEYYGARRVIGNKARWIVGMDIKAWEEFDFDADVSVKAGLLFGGRDTRQHHLQVMLEWYDGHANSGVFFEEEIRYAAVGVYFGF